MKLKIFLWTAVVFLAISSTLAFSGEWTSKPSPSQLNVPTFGDYLKKNKMANSGSLDKHSKQNKKKVH